MRQRLVFILIMFKRTAFNSVLYTQYNRSKESLSHIKTQEKITYTFYYVRYTYIHFHRTFLYSVHTAHNDDDDYDDGLCE